MFTWIINGMILVLVGVGHCDICTENLPCDDDPCFNDATCRNLVSGYRCDCPECSCSNLTAASQCQDTYTCTEDGVFPHQYFCDKYYSCSAGIKQELSCSGDTTFDPDTKSCEIMPDCQDTACGDGPVFEDAMVCMSNPCQNGGTCCDFYDGYRCFCLQGFTGVNCQIEQTTTAAPTTKPMTTPPPTPPPPTAAYIIVTPQPPTTTTPAPNEFGVFPRKGPQAGGTQVTISGQRLAEITGKVSIQFRECHDADCPSLVCPLKVNNSFTDRLVCSTDKLSGNSTDLLLKPLFVYLTNGTHSVDTEANFTYRGNPAISSIIPLESVSVGGVTLTVSGESLQSVAQPQMEVTIYCLGTELKTLRTNCTVVSEEDMHCPTPTIPDDLLQKCRDLNKEKSGSSSALFMPRPPTHRSRKRRLAEQYLLANDFSEREIPTKITRSSFKRSSKPIKRYKQWGTTANNQTIFGMLQSAKYLNRPKRQAENPDDEDSEDSSENLDEELNLEFYIGIILDGLDDYENLNESLPEFSKVTYYSNPEIFASPEPIVYRPFWPYEDNHLRIDGNGLSIGDASKTAYSVRVGSALCEKLSLVEDTMTCTPPSNRPPLYEEGDVKLIVRVFIGYLVYHYGEIDYPNPASTPIVQGIIGGAIGGAVLLLIVIVITYMCCSGRCVCAVGFSSRARRGKKNTRRRRGDRPIMYDWALQHTFHPYQESNSYRGQSSRHSFHPYGEEYRSHTAGSVTDTETLLGRDPGMARRTVYQPREFGYMPPLSNFHPYGSPGTFPAQSEDLGSGSGQGQFAPSLPGYGYDNRIELHSQVQPPQYYNTNQHRTGYLNINSPFNADEQYKWTASE